jgi:chemotaxis protein MotB
MARKKKHPEHVNHERWLVSYADFITLLFAFFVVMFAVSQVDTKKLGHFTESFSRAVGVNVLPMTGSSLLEGQSMAEQQEKAQGDSDSSGELDQLGNALGAMAGSAGDALKGLQIIRRGNELVLRLPENIFFDTGDAKVKSGTAGTLKLIAPRLLERHVEVRVEGHTDDRPIVSGRYHSNWELSSARAIGVMTILMSEGLPPERVSIAGYGEYRPIASNANEDGRRQNRRVDLVVTAMHANAEEKGAEAKADKSGKNDGDDTAGEKTGDDKTSEGATEDGKNDETADDKMQGKPEEAKSAEAKSAEAKSAEAKPAEAKPAEAKAAKKAAE